MYLGFYGLDREPFHITPDPQFLFLSPSHKEAFASMVYGVESRKGFVEVTGEVGTGKTTILRAYLEQLDAAKVRSLYLFNPDLSFDELLQYLLHEMGIEDPKGPASVMLQALHMALIEEYRLNRNVVLIIDEAQNMPLDTLEKLRMLSNLETTRDKLIQIVLVGQPELEKKLNMHELRQLKQRIAVRVAIRPLSDTESHAYIQHRLTQAGCKFGDVFAAAALKAIVKRAQGIPRTINILCDNALIAGFGAQQMPVTLPVVKEVVADLNVRAERPYLKWGVAALAAALIVTLAGVLFTRQPGGSERSLLPQSLAAASEAVTPSVAAEPSRAPEPLSGHKDIILEKMLKVARAHGGSVAKGPQESVAPLVALGEEADRAVGVRQSDSVPDGMTEAGRPPAVSAESPEPVGAVAVRPELEAAIAAAAGVQAEPTPVATGAGQAVPSQAEETPTPLAFVEAEAAVQSADIEVQGSEGAEAVGQGAAAEAVEAAVVAADSAVQGGEVEEAPVEGAESEVEGGEAEESGAMVLAQAAAVEVDASEAPAAPAETASLAPVAVPARRVSTAVPFGGGISVAASGAKGWSPQETSRLVHKGDCLSWLISDVYGFCNSEMIEMVTRRNPKIENPHRILTGDTLVFPELDGTNGTAEVAAISPSDSATPDR